MPQPATMVTSQSSPMKKSLYTVSSRPLSLRTTGIWTDSCLVPALMIISIPSLSDFTVDLDGEGCHTNVISRSVARGESKQIFLARINGNARCYGHSECDAIIMDSGVVSAIPEVTANCLDAQLIHEAAIGKIAGEQLTKLMTLGLTEKEAEEQIVNGFLK